MHGRARGCRQRCGRACTRQRARVRARGRLSARCAAPDAAPAVSTSARGAQVVCTVGAREALDATAPKRIDADGTIALIDAAAAGGVQQFVLVSSLGTGKPGFPAGVLNLFWGVLIWKRQAEAALERSGMSYTIVRPGARRRVVSVSGVAECNAGPARSWSGHLACGLLRPSSRAPNPVKTSQTPQAAWSAPPTSTSAPTSWC